MHFGKTRIIGVYLLNCTSLGTITVWSDSPCSCLAVVKKQMQFYYRRNVRVHFWLYHLNGYTSLNYWTSVPMCFPITTKNQCGDAFSLWYREFQIATMMWSSSFEIWTCNKQTLHHFLQSPELNAMKQFTLFILILELILKTANNGVFFVIVVYLDEFNKIEFTKILQTEPNIEFRQLTYQRRI